MSKTTSVRVTISKETEHYFRMVGDGDLGAGMDLVASWRPEQPLEEPPIEPQPESEDARFLRAWRSAFGTKEVSALDLLTLPEAADLNGATLRARLTSVGRMATRLAGSRRIINGQSRYRLDT